MPRPQTIKWETRVRVFLCYRRLGKAYPTARRFDIARSTVGVIVSEFEALGFSPRARPKLSREFLALAQERHLQQVVGSRAEVPKVGVLEPRDFARAGLDLNGALKLSAKDWVPKQDPLQLSEALAWHLKGTAAERAVTEASEAIVDYARRCFSLWKAIQGGLETSCEMRVLVDLPQAEQGQPFIFASFVDFIYTQLWSRLRSPSTSYAEFGDLLRRPENPDIIAVRSLPNAAVAYGESADPQAVGQGILRFLSKNLPAIRAQAQELAGLHHDLQYLDGIVKEALNGALEEDIRAGICPECPFPEVGVEDNPPRQRARRGAGNG